MRNGFIFKALVFLGVILFLTTGCSSKHSATVGGKKIPKLNEIDLNARQESRFGEGNVPLPEEENYFKDIHFDFDSARIDDIARQNIEYNAEIIKANPDIYVILEGHCDERGTAEYNLALGQRRATAVYNVLISLGIEPDRLKVISYGEEVPLDPRHNELAWEKNRRVHFAAYKR